MSNAPAASATRGRSCLMRWRRTYVFFADDPHTLEWPSYLAMDSRTAGRGETGPPASSEHTFGLLLARHAMVSVRGIRLHVADDYQQSKMNMVEVKGNTEVLVPPPREQAPDAQNAHLDAASELFLERPAYARTTTSKDNSRRGRWCPRHVHARLWHARPEVMTRANRPSACGLRQIR